MTSLPHSWITFLDSFHLPSTHWRICAYVPGWAEANFAPVLTNFALFVSLIEFDMLSGFSPTLTLNHIRQCLHLLIIRITIISFRNGEMLFILPYPQRNSHFISTIMEATKWPMQRNPFQRLLQWILTHSQCFVCFWSSSPNSLSCSLGFFKFPNKCICRVSISPDWCLGSQE